METSEGALAQIATAVDGAAGDLGGAPEFVFDGRGMPLAAEVAVVSPPRGLPCLPLGACR